MDHAVFTSCCSAAHSLPAPVVIDFVLFFSAFHSRQAKFVMDLQLCRLHNGRRAPGQNIWRGGKQHSADVCVGGGELGGGEWMLGSYCCGRSYCLHVTCEDGWTRASAGYTCTQFLFLSSSSFFWRGEGGHYAYVWVYYNVLTDSDDFTLAIDHNKSSPKLLSVPIFSFPVSSSFSCWTWSYSVWLRL